MSLELLVCTAFLVFLRTRGTGMSIFMRLPSTALHEIAHWLIALLTVSRPSPPSIFPKRAVDGGWQLGHVDFYPGRWTAGLVAMAPMLLNGPLGVALLVSAHDIRGFTGQTLWLGVVTAYLLDGCWPSKQDWFIAFKYPLSLPLTGGVLYFAYMGALGAVL